MPPYYYDCTCPATYNKTVLFFIGFLGVGTVLLTSVFRSIQPILGDDGEGEAQAQARYRIKVLEAQVERAFNAIMAMIVLVLATVLTALVSQGIPLTSDRSEL